MAVSLTVNGVTFQYPSPGDKNWGQQATGWAQAATLGMLQKAGGSFALTAEVDFGGAFGLKALYLKSKAATIATAEFLRLGNTQALAWRNAGNTANVKVYIDSDDRLYYRNGVDPAIDLTAAANGNVTGPLLSTDNAIARYDGVSGQIIQNSGVTISDANLVTIPNDITLGGVGLSVLYDFMPIGSIIPFYDFNAALSFNSAVWHYCDGSVQTVAGIGAQTLPDLSGRYLVGFGTDGGGDIGSATWATLPIGNAGHVVNLQHSHTVAAHGHTISMDGNHNHNIANHTHGAGTISCQIDATSESNKISFSSGTTIPAWSVLIRHATSGTDSPGGNRTAGVGCGGTTDGSGVLVTDNNGVHNHGGETGDDSPGTDSQLSTTQSIQPRSIRVRYIMRIA